MKQIHIKVSAEGIGLSSFLSMFMVAFGSIALSIEFDQHDIYPNIFRLCKTCNGIPTDQVCIFIFGVSGILTVIMLVLNSLWNDSMTKGEPSK